MKTVLGVSTLYPVKVVLYNKSPVKVTKQTILLSLQFIQGGELLDNCHQTPAPFRLTSQTSDQRFTRLYLPSDRVDTASDRPKQTGRREESQGKDTRNGPPSRAQCHGCAAMGRLQWARGTKQPVLQRANLETCLTCDCSFTGEGRVDPQKTAKPFAQTCRTLSVGQREINQRGGREARHAAMGLRTDGRDEETAKTCGNGLTDARREKKAKTCGNGPSQAGGTRKEGARHGTCFTISGGREKGKTCGTPSVPHRSTTPSRSSWPRCSNGKR